MSIRPRVLAFVSVMSFPLAFLPPAAAAEPAAGPRVPSPQRIENGSPEVLADGRVVFRYRSATAKSVKASGQFGPEVELTAEAEGRWTGTTAAAVAPGIYEYHLTVDGVGLPDPLNRAIKPQRWPGSSILHIPATPPAPWDQRRIPHGAVHRHAYWSEALGTWRSVVVVTPPGIQAGATTGTRLPVLYLSHGFSDTEETWTVHGRAHAILDALIDEKKAVPMLIVMPDGHALPPPSGWSDGYAAGNTDAFAEELRRDVIPLVEKNYPVRAEPSARAFAGLSMGGRHALTLALRHADVFSQVGAFSAATPDQATLEAALPAAEAINARLKLLWIACGRADFLFQKNEELHAALEKAGLRHEYLATEGDHSWPVWRRYLVDFLPRLFRDDAR